MTTRDLFSQLFGFTLDFIRTYFYRNLRWGKDGRVVETLEVASRCPMNSRRQATRLQQQLNIWSPSPNNIGEWMNKWLGFFQFIGVPAGNAFVDVYLQWKYCVNLGKSKDHKSSVCVLIVLWSEWSRSSRSIHKLSAKRLRNLLNTSEPGGIPIPTPKWLHNDIQSGGWEMEPSVGTVVIDKGQAAESLNHLCTVKERDIEPGP